MGGGITPSHPSQSLQLSATRRRTFTMSLSVTHPWGVHVGDSSGKHFCDKMLQNNCLNPLKCVKSLIFPMGFGAG